MQEIRNKNIILAAMMVLAGATMVFAHGGGYGMGPDLMGQGYEVTDKYMEGSGYPLRAIQNQVAPEDARKLEAAREKFLDDTRDLRDQMAEKRLTMQAELIKQNPDGARLIRLQQELSQLESQFDQKALQHHLEARQIAPDTEAGGGRNLGYGPNRVVPRS